MTGNSVVGKETGAKWKNIQAYQSSGTVSGGVFDVEPSSENISYECTIPVGSYLLIGEKWIVGNDIACDMNDELIDGTYTFCPTNAEYAAAGLAVASGYCAEAHLETTPATWTVQRSVTYPTYLASYGDEVKVKFDVWATTFGSCDPDGIYTNAFLLNVATNREAEAVEAFAIGSIVVTNGIVDVELPKPLAPATSFNGDMWLQCATNGLGEAEWLDIESGRYIDEKGAFLRCLIDFEHTLTPGSFPTLPTGIKTLKLLAH